MAGSWSTLLLVCLLSLAALSGSARRHKSRPRGRNHEGGPAWGPHRASFVNGTNTLDWSRDPRRVDQQVYDQDENGWHYFGWPFAMTGQLEGQELPAGLVKGDRVEPKSKGQLLTCNGYVNFKYELDYPDDHYKSQVLQHLEKYPILPAVDFPIPGYNHPSLDLCPKGEVPCTTYKLDGQPQTFKGKIGGTSVEFANRIRQLLHNYGPLALYMESDAREIDSEGFLKIQKSIFFRRIHHAVLLVGYGSTDSGFDYFKFKNSRGSKWGDNGYGYIRVGNDSSTPLAGEIELLHIKSCPQR